MICEVESPHHIFHTFYSFGLHLQVLSPNLANYDKGKLSYQGPWSDFCFLGHRRHEPSSVSFVFSSTASSRTWYPGSFFPTWPPTAGCSNYPRLPRKLLDWRWWCRCRSYFGHLRSSHRRPGWSKGFTSKSKKDWNSIKISKIFVSLSLEPEALKHLLFGIHEYFNIFKVGHSIMWNRRCLDRSTNWIPFCTSS